MYRTNRKDDLIMKASYRIFFHLFPSPPRRKPTYLRIQINKLPREPVGVTCALSFQLISKLMNNNLCVFILFFDKLTREATCTPNFPLYLLQVK